MAESKDRPHENEAQRQSRALAEARAEAEERQMDETVPGGRFMTADGRLIDCNGKPFREKRD